MRELNLMIKKPGHPVQRIHIEDVLAIYERLVEGYIEVLHPSKVTDELPKDVVFLVNEEGIYKHLQPNIAYGWDRLLGNIVVARKDDNGELQSIPHSYEWAIEEYMEKQEDLLWSRFAVGLDGMWDGVL